MIFNVMKTHFQW